MKIYKLAILTSHAIQYQVPLFRALTKESNIDLNVYYCSNYGMTKRGFDPGFGKKIKWDIPLKGGYKYKVMRNISSFPNNGFLSLINAEIMSEIQKGGYDAVIIYGYTTVTVWLAYFAAWISRTPIIYQSESHLFTQTSFVKNLVKSLIFKLLFPRISAFLAIGSPNKMFYRYYKIPEEKIFITPYSVDNDYFHKYAEKYKKRKNKIRVKLSLNNEMPVILFVAKMMPRKNPFVLLKAFQNIRRNIPAQLVFVGDGVQLIDLKKYAEENSISNVLFAGFKNQSQLPEYYAVADIFVLPSNEETWGLVINEAMNFELPIITTDKVGASIDLIKHGKNGYIYPANDGKMLEEYLAKLLLNSKIRDKMGKTSKTIINNWNYENDVKGILEALKYLNRKSIN